jgi:hypothetical protein
MVTPMRNTPWLIFLACTLACGDKEPNDDVEDGDSATDEDSTKDSTKDSTEDSTEDSTKDSTKDSSEDSTTDSTEDSTADDTQAPTDGDGDGATADLDCDDENPATFPGAAEVCDEVDNNCDGAVDEGVTVAVFADLDGDGFGDDTHLIAACEGAAATAEVGGDCDDADPAIHPDATERCDDRDNNCDGAVDEDVRLTFYLDADGDGHGDASVVTQGCSLPAGYVEGALDCDDLDAAVSPDETERCDSVDNDCDGDVDEELLVSQYADADADGYGDLTAIVLVCPGAPGYSAVAGDCDDADDTSYPAATELCDGADNDCDGPADEGVVVTLYEDKDGDGYGDLDTSASLCPDAAGYVSQDGDCDDTDPTISPSAAEVCSTSDLNCDGDTDERDLCEDCDDGLDNDTDGLTDCEDADCSGAVACVEDCGDTLDNDGDGAQDCWDDECWSSCGVVVRSHLERGAAELYTSSVYWSSGREASSWGVGFSLEGQVTVSVASEVFICDWTIDEARFERRSSSYSHWTVGPITSVNQTYEAQLSSGCGMDWETVVPPTLSITSARSAVSPWGVWYTGTISATRQTRGGFDHGFTV